MNKKLNTWTVSGLMIGPILGSGIVFLPPLAYEKLGEHAFLAWLIIMVLGALFASIFARMSLTAGSNEGISLLVGSMLGTRFRELSSNCLTAAVFFGPVAVAITAAGFIHSALPEGLSPGTAVLSLAVLLVCHGFVALGAAAMGRFVLVLSTATALLLIGGSIPTLINAPAVEIPLTLPEPGMLGSTLLLLFWAIIGWEILGSYIEDVKDPGRTLMRAMKISMAAILVIYLLTTLALQTYYRGMAVPADMNVLLIPIMGTHARTVFSILAASLCLCTMISFVGAVTRQLKARSTAGLLPPFLKKTFAAQLLLLLANGLVLLARTADLLSTDAIVGVANGFFIVNALLGLAAGFRFLKSPLLRFWISILILMLTFLLFFSKPAALAALAAVVAVTLLKPVPAVSNEGNAKEEVLDKRIKETAAVTEGYEKSGCRQ